MTPTNTPRFFYGDSVTTLKHGDYAMFDKETSTLALQRNGEKIYHIKDSNTLDDKIFFDIPELLWLDPIFLICKITGLWAEKVEERHNGKKIICRLVSH